MTGKKRFALQVTLKNQILFRGVIQNPPIVIGRSKTCDIAFEKYDFVSRNHLEIYEKEGELYFRDMKSANGLTQGGQKTTGGKIIDGLVIEIGQLNLQFKEVEVSAPNQMDKTITEISIHGTLSEALELEVLYEDLKKNNGSPSQVGIELKDLDLDSDKD